MREPKIHILGDTEETITGWIKSCTKVEQLDICEFAVDELIIPQKFPHEPKENILNAIIRLQCEILHKREKNFFQKPVLSEAIN